VVKTTGKFFKKYLPVKITVFSFEVLNIEYYELMKEIFSIPEDHSIYKIVLQVGNAVTGKISEKPL
jgi:hypothetical protein